MKTRILRMVALAAAGVLAAGSSFGQQKEMTPLDVPMIGDIQMLKVGDRAPQFVLEDVDGKSFDLAKESPKKVHLLVFWSIFCEPCKAEMPLIQRLYDENRAKGFEVLAIAMDGEPMKKSIQGLIKQHGFTFRAFIDKLAADESFVVADPYGVAGTPTLYVVGRDGKVAFADVGRTPKEAIEAAVQKALATR
ncbi:MAG: peroxiredoxin family protein [Deferrisomatales bacterium]